LYGLVRQGFHLEMKTKIKRICKICKREYETYVNGIRTKTCSKKCSKEYALQNLKILSKIRYHINKKNKLKKAKSKQIFINIKDY